MNEFNGLEKSILSQIADLESVPQGAFSLRENGKPRMRTSSQNIAITPKADKPGIDITVAAGTKNESVHIPVIMTETGLKDLVYNDFYIGEGADVLIVAGCGIDNCGGKDSEHDGVHTFHLGKNSKVRYVEKHLGTGVGTGGRTLNPVTDIAMDEGAVFEMETVQLGGVTSSVRKTKATLAKKARLTVSERILTAESQTAETNFEVELAGDDSSVDVVSRSVARDRSVQSFVSTVLGKAKCFGHVECDGIMMDKAIIRSSPQVSAENVDAMLTHEAAIGKIAGEQLVKLRSLGLTVDEAEKLIIKGFLGL